MLQRRPKFGVKNYEFTDAGILRYSARIGELRKTHHISCERMYKDGKATNTFIYRLVQPEADEDKPNWLAEKLSTLRTKISKKTLA